MEPEPRIEPVGWRCKCGYYDTAPADMQGDDVICQRCGALLKIPVRERQAAQRDSQAH